MTQTRLRIQSPRTPCAAVVFLAVLTSVSGAQETESPVRKEPVAEPPFGPLPVRVVHPLSLPFYQPSADRSQTVPEGRLSVLALMQYSSVQREDQVDDDFSIFDGEFLRSSLVFRYGLLDNLEVSAELPFYSSGPGFLDDLIKGFHNNTGFTDDLRRSHRFREVVIVNDQEVLDEGAVSFNIADIPIHLKLRLLEDGVDPFGLAVRLGIEIPTGNESLWIGSGSVEGGFGVLMEKSFLDFSAYLNVDYRLLSEPGRFKRADIDVRPVVNVAGAGEWRLWRRLAIVAQFDIAQSMFKGSELDPLDDTQVQLAVGARFRIGDRFEGMLGIMEDVASRSVPDVTFFFGLGMNIDLIRSKRGG